MVFSVVVTCLSGQSITCSIFTSPFGIPSSHLEVIPKKYQTAGTILNFSSKTKNGRWSRVEPIPGGEKVLLVPKKQKYRWYSLVETHFFKRHKTTAKTPRAHKTSTTIYEMSSKRHCCCKMTAKCHQRTTLGEHKTTTNQGVLFLCRGCFTGLCSGAHSDIICHWLFNYRTWTSNIIWCQLLLFFAL